MNSVVAIIPVKENSNRFPGKNYHLIDGVPLFWYSVKPFLESRFVHDIYVSTNSPYVEEYCKKNNVGIIFRGINCSDDNEPLLDVLKFSYKTLNQAYDVVATIMANCPLHKARDVDEAVLKIEKPDVMEVRGFNSNGQESGLLVFKSKIVTENLQISSHIESINTNGKEIHYLSELQEISLEHFRSNHEKINEKE